MNATAIVLLGALAIANSEGLTFMVRLLMPVIIAAALSLVTLIRRRAR